MDHRRLRPDLDSANALNCLIVNPSRRLGQLLIVSGEPQKAIEPLSQAVSLSPSDNFALSELGWAQSEAGHKPRRSIHCGAR